MSEVYPQLVDALAKFYEDSEITGDDVVSFFALGIALIIDDQASMKSAGDRRGEVNAAKVLVSRWVDLLATIQKEEGISSLERIRDAHALMDVDVAAAANSN